jgi:hypothetical protein
MALAQPPTTDGNVSQAWAYWFNSLWQYSVTIGQSGTTAQRPVKGLFIGRSYFDTDLGRPIWYQGVHWVDAAGAVV